MHTLLIVEDEKMIRQGIKAMVQRSGVPVEVILECANGEMALDILRTQDVDVMFTDIRMPKMDGIQLVKAMQEFPHKPLTVAISGYDEFSYAVDMLRAGVKEYMLKPVDRDQIKEVLERLEAEIQQTKAQKDNNKTIGCQQLKHLILDDFITEAEKNAIYKEYESGFYQDGYVVCCMETRDGETVADDEHIYINNLGDSAIYMMTPDLLPRYQIQEWRKQYVGVSNVIHGLEHLQEGFLQAKEARKEAFWTEHPLVKYSEIPAREEAVAEYDISLQNLVQMLGTDKYEQSIKQIKGLLWNGRRQREFDAVEEQIVSFVDLLQKNYDGVLQSERDDVEYLKHIYRHPCIGIYEERLISWLERFVDKLNHQFEDYKNKQKIQQAVVYIRENYDKDLNMAVVSNHISMNYSLFSYAFKQYTGTNFVNFLKDIRMEKAKELLEKTDLKIVEISQKIGYENEKHFMKTFKLSFGVSPTEYRRNMQFKK